MLKKSLFSLLTLLLGAAAAQGQPCKIRVAISGLRDSCVYLGYSYEDRHFVVDSARLDSSGRTTFARSSLLKRGVYFVAVSGVRQFELLLSDNQDFAVRTATSSLLDSLTFEGSPENQQFLDYQHFLRKQQALAEAVRQRQKAADERHDADSATYYQQQLADTDSAISRYTSRLLAGNGGTFLGTLLLAMQPLQVPTFDIPDSVANKDSVEHLRRYEYLCAHYFDCFNMADSGLIRTPFFASRIDVFLKKMIPPIPDTIIRYADLLIEKASANGEMLRYVTDYFFRHFQQSDYMGHDAVVVHLADKYYLSGHAAWVTEDYRAKVKEHVDKIRPTLLGSVAPELLLQTHELTSASLHKTAAEFIILCFWSPDCGHCKEELPRLWTLYQKVRDKGVAVFAIYTQYERKEWDDYLREHPYDWVNAWDGFEVKDDDGKSTTYSIGSKFRTLYDIHSTPTVFLLDKDKKIIAKRMSIENLEKILMLELNGDSR
jgi:thiol-disulfide isomerase/thioredoxin